MVVQHNINSRQTNSDSGSTSTLEKSTEKFSLSYKVSRAADDASGLSISDKMRSQVRGLTSASTNAQDGIKLVQTSEGAIAETASMLQRMHALSEQAGTSSTADRDAINSEIQTLVDEINRVAQTKEDNSAKLQANIISDDMQPVNIQTNSNSDNTQTLIISDEISSGA